MCVLKCVYLLIIAVEGQCMSYKLHYVQSQIEMAEDVSHGGPVRVHVLVSAGIVLVKIQDEKQQFPEPSLIKHAH